METLDSAELLIEDQVWLNYLWDFETREINLDFSSMLSSPGLDTDWISHLSFWGATPHSHFPYYRQWQTINLDIFFFFLLASL